MSIDGSDFEIPATLSIPYLPDDEVNEDNDKLDPVEVELKIFRNRMIEVGNELSDSLYVSLYLNELIANKAELLHPYLTNEEIDKVLRGCDPYLRPTEFDQFKFDPDLFEALNVLCKKPEIVTLSRHSVRSTAPPGVLRMLVELGQLKKFVIERFKVTAEQEHAKSQYLLTVFNKNKKAKERIQELKEKLTEQREKHAEILASKRAYIEQHEQNIAEMNMDCMNDIRKQTVEAERIMATDWKINDGLQRTLKDKSKQAAQDLENLLQANLREEKAARQRRLKTETQLLSWIQMYDKDMGERQDIYDELRKRYETENAEYNKFMMKMGAQEEEYEKLMKEKEEYYNKLWCEKVKGFIENTAAKHIQQWFRRILAQSKGRKKAAAKGAKKGGKKSKSPQTPAVEMVIVKSAPPKLPPTKESPPMSHQPSVDSRRTSTSSRRASTVPLGVTKVRTELREVERSTTDDETEANVPSQPDGAKMDQIREPPPNYGYLATLFRAPKNDPNGVGENGK